MIESEYTSNIHKKLAPEIYHWKINDNYAGGVPDAFYRMKGNPQQRPLWIEYKFIKDLPKRDTTAIVPGLSALQLNWLLEADAAGEKALVIIGVQNEKLERGASGIVLYPNEWTCGIPTAVARQRLMSYKDIAKYISEKLVT